MKWFLLLVLPLMAAATVVWKVAAIDPIDHTVLLPCPWDCSKYYSCSDGVPILMPCPDGLVFNAKLDVCDWPTEENTEHCIVISVDSGTCGWSNGTYAVCEISKLSTEVLRELMGGNWCCDSCDDSSYCGG
jgi:hypothetical protein